MKKLLAFTLIAAVAGYAWLLLPKPEPAPSEGASQKTASGSGLLQEIDKENGVVTIMHGPMPALNMMAMTMAYPVRDRNQLAGLRSAQRVEFRVSYDGNEYVITEIR